MADAPSEAPTIQIEEVPTPTFLQKATGSLLFLFLFVWVLAGIAAVIMSIVCFGFSGTATDKVVGLALAFFLGPLYFIFYAVNKNYCRSMNAAVVNAVNQVVG